MKKKKGLSKLWIFAVILLISCSVATAVWLFGLNLTGYYFITSDTPDIVITQSFSGDTLNTQNSSVSINDTAIIKNNNGDPINMTFNISVSVEDFNDSCIDYLEDCELEFYFANSFYPYGSNLIDGDWKIFEVGDNNITTKLMCARYSCPQNITTEFYLEQQV